MELVGVVVLALAWPLFILACLAYSVEVSRRKKLIDAATKMWRAENARVRQELASKSADLRQVELTLPYLQKEDNAK